MLAAAEQLPEDVLVGVVFYHEWSTPLLDPTPRARGALASFQEIPSLPGRPEPVLGVAEAFHMAEDYRAALYNPLVLILWTAVARPRTPLTMGFNLLRGAGLEYVLAVSKAKLPGWAGQVGVEEDGAVLY
ncbi:hypothetical protein apy_15380, partial [Aeropyrum pernix]